MVYVPPVAAEAIVLAGDGHLVCTRRATALRDAGAEVVMTERVGSHGERFWQESCR